MNPDARLHLSHTHRRLGMADTITLTVPFPPDIDEVHGVSLRFRDESGALNAPPGPVRSGANRVDRACRAWRPGYGSRLVHGAPARRADL